MALPVDGDLIFFHFDIIQPSSTDIVATIPYKEDPFVLGTNQVHKGFETVVRTLRKDEESWLFLSASEFFGNKVNKKQYVYF